jgi:hypothetical protein
VTRCAGGALLRASWVLLAAAFAGTPAARAETSWGVQLFVGVPFNFPSRVTIRQEGAPDLRFRGRFETRPFERPWYYGVGAFRRGGGREWWAELVHHKLHLLNPPPEVQDFSISHGYNFVLVGGGIEAASGVWTRVGAGVVVAHPESTVRGRALREGGGAFGLGYHLAGPALSAGLEGRVPLGDRARLTLGARLLGGYAVVPVEGGTARVPNLAVHATAGVDGDVFRVR